MIKKKIIMFAFIFVSLFMFISSVNAASFVDDYEYTIDEENNKVLITKYRGTDTDVVVPAKASISSKNYDVVVNGPLFSESLSNVSTIKSVVFKSGLTIKNAYRLFFNATSVESIIFENDINTEELTSFKQTFYNTTSLRTLDFGNLDSSHVTDMSQMFQSCNIKTLDISGLDMTNVTNAESMFSSRTITKIKLGSKNNFHVSTEVRGVPFGRGAWKRVSDGKEFSSLEIALKTETEDMSGEYVFLSDISSEITPKFPVTYKIKFKNTAEIQEAATDSRFKLIDSTDNKKKYLYYDMYKENGEFTTDSNDYVVLKLRDCVNDKDGNLYDLQMKISNFVAHGMPNDQSVDSAVYLLLTSNASLLFSNTIYASGDAIVNGERYLSASDGYSNFDVEFKVLDKNGNPVEGSYIFSAYDIDIPANVNLGDDQYISYTSTNPVYGFGYHSEGVNLYRGGFDESTLLKSKSYSFLYEIDTNLPEGVFKRFTGTRSDAGTEASEFVIKADSLGAKVQFTFGRNAGISVLSYYQPKIVRIDNKNEQFENLVGSKFVLVDQDGNTVAEWTSSKEPDSFFLNPGKYTIKQLSVEDDYIISENVDLVVDSMDKIIVNGTVIDGDLVTVFNRKKPTEETAPVEEAKKCSYKKENGKITYYDTEGNEITKDEWSNKCAEPVPTGSFLPIVGIVSGFVLVIVSFLVTKKKSKLKNI